MDKLQLQNQNVFLKSNFKKFKTDQDFQCKNCEKLEKQLEEANNQNKDLEKELTRMQDVTARQRQSKKEVVRPQEMISQHQKSYSAILGGNARANGPLEPEYTVPSLSGLPANFAAANAPRNKLATGNYGVTENQGNKSMNLREERSPTIDEIIRIGKEYVEIIQNIPISIRFGEEMQETPYYPSTPTTYPSHHFLDVSLACNQLTQYESFLRANKQVKWWVNGGSLCTKAFFDMKEFVSHVHEEHLDRDQNKSTWEYCKYKKPFLYTDELLDHISKHVGKKSNKPRACSYKKCAKVSSRT